ncbi:MAG: hypothetical protein NAOJABEB_01344 [Steroidobacteraceae bacterium]|nr:hypothetical protein [Steroidobacteraceae bacterium]
MSTSSAPARTERLAERPPILRFGPFELDRANRELRKQGLRIRLQEQPFHVLAVLLERAGSVVTRDELREQLWASSIYVDFDHGLNNAIARLREALGDTAATPQFIETVPRVGYRFIYPVVSGIVPIAGATAAAPAAPASGAADRRRHWSWLAAGAVVASLLVIGVLIDDAPTPDVAVQSPSLVVLPFHNLSSEPDGELFADGLTVELLNKVAAIPGLKVIGQTSSFHFKGENAPLPVIARTLGVAHVLEGSVQRSGERLRVAVQLVAAADGAQLWSQTFDRRMTDLFQVQEDIAFAVAGALQVKLLAADERRLRKRATQDVEAQRLLMIGNAYDVGIAVRLDRERARQLFEKAIARDPGYADAHAALARNHFRRAFLELADSDQAIALATVAMERAIALDPDSSSALQARANIAMWRYRFVGDFAAYAQAQADFRRAMQVDPSNYTVRFDYGRAVFWSEPELAQSLFQQIEVIDPLVRGGALMQAAVLGSLGMNDAAGRKLNEVLARTPVRDARDQVFVAGHAYGEGRLGDALVLLRPLTEHGGAELKVWRWGLEMSIDETAMADQAFAGAATGLENYLRSAARELARGRPARAYELLDARRGEFPVSRSLDVPTARLALVTGKPEAARILLEQRFPDLVAGIEPINGHNLMPALDLATAWLATGRREEAQELLMKAAEFVRHPTAPRSATFHYLRARLHALAGEGALAFQALNRAFDAGLRSLWALDLHPQPFLYLDAIESDPAFVTLQSDARYRDWLQRIKTANARELEALQSRERTSRTVDTSGRAPT